MISDRKKVVWEQYADIIVDPSISGLEQQCGIMGLNTSTSPDPKPTRALYPGKTNQCIISVSYCFVGAVTVSNE